MKKIKTLIFIFKFYFLFFFVKVLHLYYKVVGYKKPTKDILYLESMPEDGAGYTYRVKHWIELFIQDGYKVESDFILRNSSDFFKQTSDVNLQKFLIKSVLIRIKQIHYSRQFKIVIVRRGLLIYNQYGNNFMEKLLKAAHPNKVLDFDDDIGTNKIHNKSDTFFQKFMLNVNDHFYKSFNYYNAFIPGSNYLRELIKSKHNYIDDHFIQTIPTCVNYDDYSPKVYSNSNVLTFGWIGGNHNLSLLKDIMPALNSVSQKVNIQLIIMAGVDKFNFFADFPVFFEKYSLDKEISYLKRIDIGLMPLSDDEVSRGKCGFKLLQYMGVGVPGIASAITVNNEIINDNRNGWLVAPNDDWTPVLEKVVSNLESLPEFGLNARKTVLTKYTFRANYNSYKKFIEQLMN